MHQLKNEVFLDKEIAQEWEADQCKLLLDSKVKTVRNNIEKIAAENDYNIAATTITNYYTSTLHKKDYISYKSMGAGIIASGAIESAHRSLKQSRCKQSGQVRSIDGLQNMLNLRTVHQKNDFKKLETYLLNKLPNRKIIYTPF